MADVSVKMLVSMASERNDRKRGEIVTVSEQEAQRLYEKGFAEPADGAPAKKGRPAKSEKPPAED